MKNYEPGAGEHIVKAAASAIELAKASGDFVSFFFNDVQLVVSKDSTPEEVGAEYNRITDRRHKEYLASPAGKAA
jgi:hypothetical protein